MKTTKINLFLVGMCTFLFVIAGCMTREAHLPKEEPEQYQHMRASFYGGEFEGKKTASGEIFRAAALTAAHRTLPFGTKLEVVNPVTHKSVQVRVNDRGPDLPGRTLDLSRGAAKEIGLTGQGVQTVMVRVLP